MQPLRLNTEAAGDLEVEWVVYSRAHHRATPKQPWPRAEAWSFHTSTKCWAFSEAVWCDGKNVGAGARKPEFEACFCQLLAECSQAN